MHILYYLIHNPKQDYSSDLNKFESPSTLILPLVLIAVQKTISNFNPTIQNFQRFYIHQSIQQFHQQ